ncbi:MAG: NB-ARC domain-containing protein [Bacteroidia bacterium]
MQHLLSLLQNALDKVKEGKIDTALTLILAENTFAHDTEFLQCATRWNLLQKEKRDGVIKEYAHLESDIARSLIQILQAHIKEREAKILPDFPSMNPDLLNKEGFLWGRKSELGEIESAYKAGKDIVLLHGIGGIGKTTLLLAYANQAEAKAHFTTRIWIDIQEMPATPTAETDLLLESLIPYFRSPLALTGKSKTEQQTTIQQHFLHLGKKTLLVLDNFNEQQQLQKSIAWLRSLHIAVLISSRAEIENVSPIHITALSDEASLSAFKAFNPTPYPHETLTALLAALQHHPLLIELCAKHLRKKRSLQLPTLIEAANKVDLSCLTTTHFTTKRDTYIEKSIADFLIDLFPFTQLTAAEQQMLRYFSLLSPRPYSLNALMELFGSLSDSRNEPNNLSNSSNENPNEPNNPVSLLSDSRNELTQETETLAIDELLSNLKNLGWLEEQIAENENSPLFSINATPLFAMP